eukprot:TRINITY_DN6102_c0_g1_i1.p2 TRINITY_DN6102_c0_g1~~TRINITY_DN6102_c0_g1_i1.p2  ORF type:complete len:62 (-),score=12.06 TRINITY_DN6102_c0_g1_i1:117-302(-)
MKKYLGSDTNGTGMTEEIVRTFNTRFNPNYPTSPLSFKGPRFGDGYFLRHNRMLLGVGELW